MVGISPTEVMHSASYQQVRKLRKGFKGMEGILSGCSHPTSSYGMLAHCSAWEFPLLDRILLCYIVVLFNNF